MDVPASFVSTPRVYLSPRSGAVVSELIYEAIEFAARERCDVCFEHNGDAYLVKLEDLYNVASKKVK